ncbi:LysE family translocator [Crenalkalicoccus roseus]|uniref:LysE family translocator n=1 Tax=Crenalkalicoccus roseus TaxID=1485588 RepID=UPI001081E179|nr:LysE family translocator [Crenalkalicoccus roseus]
MPSAETLLVFAALSLGLALTPGPNMLYLVSRALAQGTGMVSLLGCQAGSLAIMLAAAAGITAALLAIPHAWDVLRLAGAAYLAFLAWQCLRPGGRPLFAPRPLPREPAARLFGIGLATAALNPKVAPFYMAALPPFLDPVRGDVFLQGMVLGAVQIGVAVLFDALLVLGAAGVARFLGARPGWMAAQRWLLGGALALLAARLAAESRP